VATYLYARLLYQAIPLLVEPGEIAWIAAKWRDRRVLTPAFKY
jgi:hypothetical protein